MLNENTLATSYFKDFMVSRLVTDLAADLQLNMLKVPSRHMGITRSDMPQINSKDLGEFERHLLTKGITMRKKMTLTKDLTLTQCNFSKLKVLKIMRQISVGRKVDPVLVSKDGYVLDGSHRFLAVHNTRDGATIPTFKASANIRDLMLAAKSFPKSQYRSWNE